VNDERADGDERRAFVHKHKDGAHAAKTGRDGLGESHAAADSSSVSVVRAILSSFDCVILPGSPIMKYSMPPLTAAALNESITPGH
jgi:hypothetical protein